MKKRSIWQDPKDRISIKLHEFRGSSVTIFGAISNRWAWFEHMTADRTNQDNLAVFLDQLKKNRLQKEEDVILVMD